MLIAALHRSVWFLTAGIGLGFLVPQTYAQEYPVKAITFIVPNTPGTLPDAVARVMSSGMSKALGQPVIVENRAGASMVIGLEYLARQAPADGYTITILATSNLALLPVTTKDLRFDPLKDLPPFIGLAE